MDIRTKFDVGDNVYFIDNNGSPQKGIVKTVDVRVREIKKSLVTEIEYSIPKGKEFFGERIPEKRVFRTKGSLAEYALSLTANL